MLLIQYLRLIPSFFFFGKLLPFDSLLLASFCCGDRGGILIVRFAGKTKVIATPSNRWAIFHPQCYHVMYWQLVACSFDHSFLLLGILSAFVLSGHV